MPDYEITVTARLRPSVIVTVEADGPADITDSAIAAALEDMAQEMNLEGYVAEWMVTEGGGWDWTEPHCNHDPAAVRAGGASVASTSRRGPMAKPWTTAADFEAATRRYHAARLAFADALTLEISRVTRDIDPGLTELTYALEYNEDGGLSAEITAVDDAALTEFDALRDEVEPLLSWLAELDGSDATPSATFYVR